MATKSGNNKRTQFAMEGLSPSEGRILSVRTQKDLARLAGVSLNTVYNAIHKKEIVHEETREKIYRLMREYDYHPDGIARSMVRGKTDVLGIIVPSLEIPYYAKVVSGIERAANASGYHCIICQHLDDSFKEEREVTMMRQRRVDGMLIRNCGRETDTRFIQRLVAASIPVVLFDGRTEGFDEHFVGGDDRADAEQAVNYLIEKGHRRIAFIGWFRSGDFHTGPRYLGYCDALERHGLKVDPALAEQCQTEYDSGRLEMLNILRRTAGNPPTAVLGFNDHTAVGIIEGLAEAGIKVPEQMAVVGFGGYIDKIRLPFPLTTMVQNIEEMARQACRMLISQVEDKPYEKGPILVRGSLRPGGSG